MLLNRIISIFVYFTLLKDRKLYQAFNHIGILEYKNVAFVFYF